MQPLSYTIFFLHTLSFSITLSVYIQIYAFVFSIPGYINKLMSKASPVSYMHFSQLY